MSRTHVATIQERFNQIETEMNAFLIAHEYNQAFACMSRQVRQAIFGKYYTPEALNKEKQIVRRVKAGMFHGKDHIFCVYVQSQENSTDYYIPTRRGGDTFDIAVPLNEEVQIHIKSLIDASTPPLDLYYQEHENAEKKQFVWGSKSSRFDLEYTEPMLLDKGLFIDDDNANDMYILKSEENVALLTMNLHSANWSDNKRKIDGSQGYAVERDLLHRIIHKFRADTPLGDEDLLGAIEHLQENFEHIVIQLDTAHTKKLRTNGTSGPGVFQHTLFEMRQLLD